MGKLISIEGLDGCGKTTQIQLLKESLEAADQKVATLHFPYYESETGKRIKAILTGKAPRPSADVMTELFIEDRSESPIRELVQRNDFTLVDRYIHSGIAYNMPMTVNDSEFYATFPDAAKARFRREIFDNKIPAPDAAIFLSVDLDTITDRLEDRDFDSNETNFNYLKEVKSRFEYMAMGGFFLKRIDCGDLTPDEINEEIWLAAGSIIDPLLIYRITPFDGNHK